MLRAVLLNATNPFRNFHFSLAYLFPPIQQRDAVYPGSILYIQAVFGRFYIARQSFSGLIESKQSRVPSFVTYIST